MKKLSFILIAILLGLLPSCKKKNATMTVVKDCTGTYLRLDSKDYHVNNPELVVDFPNGTTVNAIFEKSNSSSEEEITCKLLHTSEGWIHVDKIK